MGHSIWDAGENQLKTAVLHDTDTAWWTICRIVGCFVNDFSIIFFRNAIVAILASGLLGLNRFYSVYIRNIKKNVKYPHILNNNRWYVRCEMHQEQNERNSSNSSKGDTRMAALMKFRKNNEKSFENQQSSMWEIDHNTNPDHWVEVNPLSHDWVESTYHWRCSLKCHGFEQKFCFEMHFQSHCHFKTKNPHHGQSGFCAVADRDDTRGFNTTVSNLFESVICRRLHT